MDSYERRARLAPALLATIPVMGAWIALTGTDFTIQGSAIGLMASAGVFFMMGSIARELGKRLEKDAFASWGGKPTTLLLRHGDATIDPITKARYHRVLSRRLGIPFPTVAQERDFPAVADKAYIAGAQWLLDQTRDQKVFAILLNENIAYGFRRNGLGLKPYALLIAAGAFMWVLCVTTNLSSSGLHFVGTGSSLSSTFGSLAISVIAFLAWTLFFTRQTLRTAAFSYGDMLLRACDLLSTPYPSAPTTK